MAIQGATGGLVGDGSSAPQKTHPSLGAPGDCIHYVPRRLFGGKDLGVAPTPIAVRVPGADIPTIFAHRQWHAGMLLGDLIYGGHIPVQDKIVLELGAGTGVPSITAALFGSAAFVLSTDYDSPPLVATLRANVQNAFGGTISRTRISVMGHTWGHGISDVGDAIPAARKTESFDIVLLADCIWDGLSHSALLQSISRLLAHNTDARVYLASGLHTGRDVVVSFLRKAYKAGLQTVPIDGAKHDDTAIHQSWPSLDVDDIIRQELLLAQLKASGDDALVPAVQHIYELQINPVKAEDDAGFPLDQHDPSGPRAYRANHQRLTGRRRVFCVNEREEERRENNGVHLRNQWMTFTALAWRKV